MEKILCIKNKSFLVLVALCLALGFLLGSPAHAALVMTLDDPSTPGIDATVPDADNDGLVTFIGSFGNFSSIVMTGLSKPIIGAPNSAKIQLGGVATSGSAGTLEIKLTDTDFAPFPNQSTDGLTLSNAIGGTSNGPLTAQGFLDPDNQEFGETLTTGSQGPLGPGAFDDTVSDTVFLDADGQPFSLSETVTITHAGAGMVSSFSKVLEASSDSDCTGSIGDFVWNDLNRDGIQDTDEPGINDVTVWLKDDIGNIIATTVTAIGPGGNDGFYEFSGLCAGDYIVEVDESTLPPNFVPSPCNEGGDDTIDNDCSPVNVHLPDDNSHDPTYDFGYNSPCTGSIGDFVWHDLNRDGIQDAGEPGIDGVTVNLKDDQGAVIATTTTGPNGFYQFSGLCAGDYIVEVDESTLPPNFVPSPCNVGGDDEIDNDCSPVDVNLPNDNTHDPTYDFGYNSPCTGSIGDFVWHDINKDGFQDLINEPGINGVTVWLEDDIGNIIATTVTLTGPGGDDGFYEFRGLCAGDYIVVVDLNSPALLNGGFVPTGFCSSDQTISNDSNADGSPIDCTPSQTVNLFTDDFDNPTIDFGFVTEDCEISVEKFCSVPAPPDDFVCSDAKPIDSLTMIWGGSQDIDEIAVYRDKFDPNDPNKNLMYTISGPIMTGDTVTADGYAAADARNDVDWYITFAGGTNGVSRFHRSCSDEDMNGPEDCGNNQGNAKNNTDPSFVNDWLFEGMAGNGLALDCTPDQQDLQEECEVYAITPGSCEDDKPTALVFEYIAGTDCSDTTNYQEDKFKCIQSDLMGALLNVEMTKDPGKFAVETNGNLVRISYDDPPGKEFPSEIKYRIITATGTQDHVLHTSCSKALEVGDQFGSLILQSFIPKGGSLVTENVIYTYVITNNGAGPVTVSVVDDLLGDLTPDPPDNTIPGGGTLELSAAALLSDPGFVMNTVTVTDVTDPACEATDEVTVEVVTPPTPPATCDELKPIDALILEYDASQAGGLGIQSVAWYRDKYDPNDPTKNLIDTTGPVVDGDVVTFDGFAAADAKNDVDFFIIFDDNSTATSRFHRSCSDEEMNDISDCGTLQGDGKDNNAGLNTWRLRDLAGNGKVLGCP